MYWKLLRDVDFFLNWIYLFVGVRLGLDCYELYVSMARF